MHVTVRLFARLRDIVGTSELRREAADGDTLKSVWDGLVAEHPALASYTNAVSCARNEDYARWTTPVAEGDEVAFLPPVSGG
jgi:molybdopterin converting factor subunit 1